MPTPVDATSQLSDACRALGGVLRRDSLVVVESTVFPETTRDVCVPILERASGLVCGADFLVAYSPERINPGDNRQRPANTTKLIAGLTPQSLTEATALYGGFVRAELRAARSNCSMRSRVRGRQRAGHSSLAKRWARRHRLLVRSLQA
jgi:UDP-N-acetyl-D-galactosamine dehydrogenase